MDNTQAVKASLWKCDEKTTFIEQVPVRTSYPPGVPAVIDVDDYPQLALIAWNRRERRVSRGEAFALYESAPAWVDVSRMGPGERVFFEGLVRDFGRGVYLG